MDTLPHPEDTLHWLVSRQVPPPPPKPASESSDSDDEEEVAEPKPVRKPMAGFQGRIGKDTDACYSFWCTAADRKSVV